MKLISFPAKPTVLTQMVQRALPRLDGFAGPWVAGGAARCIALGEDLPAKADIDVFFRGLRQEFPAAANQMLGDMIGRGCSVTMREETKAGTINLLTRTQLQPHLNYDVRFQLIASFMSNTIQELLAGFDFTCSQVATDGRTVWTTEDALFDMRSRTLRPVHPTGSIRVERYIKHINRGFHPVDGLFERVALKTHEIAAPEGKANVTSFNARIENFGDY